MNLIMSGLDHSTADIALREKFFIPEDQAGLLCKRIKEENGLYGCVLLNTCNRIEIYMSLEEGRRLSPATLLLEAIGLDVKAYGGCFQVREGEDALHHLMETAAGLRSQIFGDDQIVSQVQKALVLSREIDATDSILETVFRYAVTAAKKIKTEVRLTHRPPSVAEVAVDAMKNFFGGLEEKKMLVIGNGEMGRLAAARLKSQGATVVVTLREYKYKPVLIPDGCETVAFGQRYQVMEEFDGVLSATTSPHYTITRRELGACPKLPKLLVDLALPRDIEPEAATLGLVLFNLDMLQSREEKPGMVEALAIIQGQKEKYFKWLAYKMKVSEVRA